MHFHRLHVNLRKVIFLEYLVFGLRQHFTPSILRPGREPWHRRWLPRRAFVNDHHHIRASERSSPACAGWLLLAIFLTPSAHPQQCSLSSNPSPCRTPSCGHISVAASSLPRSACSHYRKKSVFSGLNEFWWFSASRQKSHGSFESHKDVAENNFMFPFIFTGAHIIVEYMIIFYSFYSLVAKNLMPPKFFEICTARVAPLPTLSPHALSRSDVSQSSHHPPQRAASALRRPTPCTATAFIRRSSSVRRCHPRSLICMPPPPSASPPAAGPWTTAPPVIGDQLSCCF
jgi:hypothetical protein